MKPRRKSKKEIMSQTIEEPRAVKNELMVFRAPAWLKDISEKAWRARGAKNFADYMRGLILKDAKGLCINPPEGTHEEWPEWAMKKKYEIDDA
jgi:hypothetical protein